MQDENVFDCVGVVNNVLDSNTMKADLFLVFYFGWFYENINDIKPLDLINKIIRNVFNVVIVVKVYIFIYNYYWCNNFNFDEILRDNYKVNRIGVI